MIFKSRVAEQKKKNITPLKAGENVAVSGGEAVVAGDIAVTAGEAAEVALGGPEALALGAAGLAVGTAYEAGKEALTKAEESYEDLDTFWNTYHRHE